MGGKAQASSQNLCEVNAEADVLDIEISTSGDCNAHCEFKSGKSNSVTCELTIENNEIVTYHFGVSLEIDTNYTRILSSNLPDCKDIESNKSKTFSVEVWQQNGPPGNRETLTFDVTATSHEDYCDDAEPLDADIDPQLEFK